MDAIKIVEDDEREAKKRKALDGQEPYLPPVAPEQSGQGLPYAPQDWPNPGDVWGWRVGRRVASNGYFYDRYLYLPRRLHTPGSSSRKKHRFASKLAVERFVRSAFPDEDVDAFFRSFSWKIPFQPRAFVASSEHCALLPPHSEEITKDTVSDSEYEGVLCKARNKRCQSLIVEEKDAPTPAMPCDICCSEPQFCRNCCCILCCRTVSPSYGGYSYIRCEAVVEDYYICGHVAHLNCALQTYMAGTVGGSIDLHTEYFCRRCDMKTSLLPHVTKILETCKSIDSKAEIEKMLDLGLCVLRGSESPDAKRLLNSIASALSKLKCGRALEDIWKENEEVPDTSNGEDIWKENEEVPDTSNGGLLNEDEPKEATNSHKISVTATKSPDVPSTASDYSTNVLQLEDEISQVLQKLKKSQTREFRHAEEALHAQKNHLQYLYQQHDKERSELLSQTSKMKKRALESALLRRREQIRQELIKLKDMESVAMGFGRTSKQILKEHFGLEVED